MRPRRVGSFVETSAPSHSHPTQAKALKAGRFSAFVLFFIILSTVEYPSLLLSSLLSNYTLHSLIMAFLLIQD